MILEALLAYAHFAAILTVVVFMTSEAALCRPQWFNAEVVRRLGRVDAIYWGGLVAVLATGGARMAWGVKGLAWYAAQPLLQLKIALFVVIALISLQPTRAFARWRRTLAATGQLPAPAELSAARRWVMIASHLLVLLPLAAVFLARGVGTT